MSATPAPAPADAPASAWWGMLLVTLIWGANFSISKLALRTFPPLGFSALRFALAAALLAAILARREGDLRAPPGTARTLLGLGLVGNTIYQLGFVFGLARTSATNSALILATVPAVVTALGELLGIERTTPRMRVGVATATVGVVLVVLGREGGLAGGAVAGDLLIAFAVLCWSLYTVGVRRVGGMSSLRLTTLTMLAGTPPLVLLGLPDLARLDWGAVSGGAWAALAYSAAMSLVVAYLLWNRSVALVGSSRTAVAGALTPVFAGVIAWLALGERPRPLLLAGAALVLGGILLARHGPVPAEG